jgi:hypothetical protein
MLREPVLGVEVDEKFLAARVVEQEIPLRWPMRHARLQ